MRDLKIDKWWSIEQSQHLSAGWQAFTAVTEQLQGVARAAGLNADRLRFISWLPDHIALVAKDYATMIAIAWIEVAGSYPPSAQYHTQENCDRVLERARYYVKNPMSKPGLPGNTSGVARHEHYFIAHEKVKHGYEMLMQTQIVSCWTMFETLATDLWVTAINCQPMGLARLTGNNKRIGRLTNENHRHHDDEGSELDAQESLSGDAYIKLADIDRLTTGNYDLTHKMGTLLRSRFKFTTLSGIRKAYSAAFSEKEKRARTTKIDSILANKAIDALSAIRNVIIHKGGIADSEYVEKVKNVPLAPQANEGQPVELDGEICHQLVESTITLSVELLKSVDSWLVSTRQ